MTFSQSTGVFGLFFQNQAPVTALLAEGYSQTQLYIPAASHVLGARNESVLSVHVLIKVFDASRRHKNANFLLTFNLTQQMKCFQYLLGLFHISIREKAHRAHW